MPVQHNFFNYISLSVIQAVNAVLPLVIFPLVLARYGSEIYSRVVISEVIFLLLVAAVLYSFDLVGVRRVVQTEEDADGPWLSALFFEILTTRVAIFAALALPMLAGIFLLFPHLFSYALGWALVPLSYAIQPNWLFQAKEQNFPLAAISLVTRSIFVLYFLFGLPADAPAYLVPALIGATFLTGALLSAGYCIVHYRLTPIVPDATKMAHALWAGKEIFMSNFSVALYRDSNVLLLGFLAVRPDLISLYSLAEKFVKAVQASCRPLNQLFYPGVMRVAKEHSVPSRGYLRALLPLVRPQFRTLVAIWILILLGCWLLLDPARLDIQPEAFTTLLGVLCVMSFATFFGVANFMLGSAALNAIGYDKVFLRLVVATGALALTTNVILIHFLALWGGVIGFVASEGILLALITGQYLRRPSAQPVLKERGLY